MGKWIFGYVLIRALTLLAAQWGSRAVTVFTENTPAQREHTVIVDPGHGGVDGGATSCTGVPESRFNLEIGLRLGDMLEFLGYRTVLIRREDVSVYTKGETIAQKKVSDLKQRVSLINEWEGAILLSIHQNYFADSRYAGAQVFYAATEGSRELARALQDALVRTLNPGSNRKEKKSSGIYLMEHIRCPGVLIECGFLSNPEEEARLRSPGYQKQLCALIACTLGKYLSNT